LDLKINFNERRIILKKGSKRKGKGRVKKEWKKV
jgi:hypothetical protein